MLTPNHFLIGRANTVPIPLKNNQDKCLRKEWHKAQNLADNFWRRWTKEYLPTLTLRHKWFENEDTNLKVDDLVILCDGNQPRNSWPKGVVVALHPDRDGKTRVVDVKTVNGVFRRPVMQLVKITI